MTEDILDKVACDGFYHVSKQSHDVLKVKTLYAETIKSSELDLILKSIPDVKSFYYETIPQVFMDDRQLDLRTKCHLVFTKYGNVIDVDGLYYRKCVRKLAGGLRYEFRILFPDNITLTQTSRCIPSITLNGTDTFDVDIDSRYNKLVFRFTLLTIGEECVCRIRCKIVDMAS